MISNKMFINVFNLRIKIQCSIYVFNRFLGNNKCKTSKSLFNSKVLLKKYEKKFPQSLNPEETFIMTTIARRFIRRAFLCLNFFTDLRSSASE